MHIFLNENQTVLNNSGKKKEFWESTTYNVDKYYATF